MDKKTNTILIVIAVVIILIIGIAYAFTGSVVSDPEDSNNDDEDITEEEIELNGDDDETEGDDSSDDDDSNDTPSTTSLRIHFVDSTHPDYDTSCGVTGTVTREVPYTVAVADASLREILAGPTAEEIEQGFVSSYHPDSSTHFQDGVEPLIEYYNGVTIQEGAAIVDFDEEALQYLNAPACLQASVKAPIRNTLMQFSTIVDVRYSIEGEIFDEWDA